MAATVVQQQPEGLDLITEQQASMLAAALANAVWQVSFLPSVALQLVSPVQAKQLVDLLWNLLLAIAC